jgi:hypothetical protein
VLEDQNHCVCDVVRAGGGDSPIEPVATAELGPALAHVAQHALAYRPGGVGADPDEAHCRRGDEEGGGVDGEAQRGPGERDEEPRRGWPDDGR